MKLTVQQVWDATLLLARIINEQRQLPAKGKYRVARMHAKLMPEFTTISEQRDALITSYGCHPKVKAEDGSEHDGEGYTVPPDKEAEFKTAWSEIATQEIEVDVTPIPFAQLDLGDAVNGSIEAHELIVLGDLVAE